ncbi:MAG TPA: thioredoxin family protein [Chitinophagaceae bacterium]|nr:thioredoxin family protein [Chitinophagaceae bacterium]MCB9056673.1 thioredoxin family protein [Chitinophagales bacterium]HPG11161.1 thioredoxin family protein [Chitinophagaceae bacterium]HRX93931.1 thioredoxin family protein [Chitinophagaceae bacterium]
MRYFSILLAVLLLFNLDNWENDFDRAKEKAAKEHKLILLNFSGSDWCVPCIRMRKEIFENNSFTDLANKELILVNADFPRLKKNKPSKEQQEKNNALAEIYNSDGSFPCTLLLDEKGNTIKKWIGFPGQDPEGFIAELKNTIHAGNSK